jgi:DNA-binding GntR family transcriptional regulator
MEKEQSLREAVHTYFCEQMKLGRLTADNYINQSEICQELNISKAPLRDALIQLETEGFVTIFPRKGVLINAMALKDVKEAYDLLAALESSAVLSAFDRIDSTHIKKMEAINSRLLTTLENGQFDEYYQLNTSFHRIFLELAENRLMMETISPIMQRLYNFPLRTYVVEWEKINLSEHTRMIDSIKKENFRAAASILQFEHWSFTLHETHIRQFYQL